MALTVKDYKGVLDIIDTAYSVNDLDGMFRAVCEKLERLIGLSGAAFTQIDPKTGNFIFGGHAVYNEDPASTLLFTSYYAAIHPLKPSNKEVLSRALKGAIRLTDVVPASRLQDTEYGCDFLLRLPALYKLCFIISHGGEVMGGMAIHRKRTDRDFKDRDIEVINSLLPHLGRVLHFIICEGKGGDLRSRLADCGLTKRQEDVAALAASGLSNREISAMLSISEQTVKDHLSNVFRILNIRSRSGLAAILTGISKSLPETVSIPHL